MTHNHSTPQHCKLTPREEATLESKININIAVPLKTLSDRNPLHAGDEARKCDLPWLLNFLNYKSHKVVDADPVIEYCPIDIIGPFLAFLQGAR